MVLRGWHVHLGRVVVQLVDGRGQGIGHLPQKRVPVATSAKWKCLCWTVMGGDLLSGMVQVVRAFDGPEPNP